MEQFYGAIALFMEVWNWQIVPGVSGRNMLAVMLAISSAVFLWKYAAEKLGY